ncbi:hypothetical protein [Mucilaginibacter antarcticus]|uniref:hypothetical protein n=1 Tax=Mucilaginibacter antarcticus TaxID=1855725 RepID=UPI00363AA8EF
MYTRGYQRALSQAKARGWAVRRRNSNGGLAVLRGMDKLGFPRYLTSFGNTPAAATTGTNQVQPGAQPD